MHVDSGASEIVVSPDVARNLPLIHTSQVGTEYELANGGAAVNSGEKRAVTTKLGSKNSMIMMYHVVKAHKPLLAVSRPVEGGNQVHFDKFEPHILLASGEKVPMSCRDGIDEIEIWIRNPGFARPTR